MWGKVTEYADVFTHSERIGELYIEVKRFQGGSTFTVYVVPLDIKVKDHDFFGVMNKEAVKVYDDVQGFFNSHKWLHEGPWVDDFERVYKERKAWLIAWRLDSDEMRERSEKEKLVAQEDILSRYKGA